jgi:antitoxin CptB
MDACGYFVGEVVAAQEGHGLFKGIMTDPFEMRRKKLLWRACHRGIKEMDILMGGFAKARLALMGERELQAFESLIELPDQEILTWITGEAAVPAGVKNMLLPELLKFRP